MNPVKIKSSALRLLLAFLAFMLVSCGGGGEGGGSGTQTTTTQTGLTIIAVNDASVPLVAVATDKYGTEAIGASVEKDATGKPTRLTAIHYFASGVAGAMEVGLDGLPSVLSDEAGNKLVFTNYTNTTVDMTFIDHEGNLIVGPQTISIDVIALAEFKSAYATALQGSAGVQAALTASEDVAMFENRRTWVRVGTLAGSAVLCGAGITSSVLAPPLVVLAAAGCISTIGGIASEVTKHFPGVGLPANTQSEHAYQVESVGSFIASTSIEGLSSSATGGFLFVVDTIVDNVELLDFWSPTPPLNLESRVITHAEVNIAWLESVDTFAVAGYRIFRDDFRPGAEIGYSKELSFKDTIVSHGITYCYRVQAYDVGRNDSELSDPLCITTKTAPKPLAVTAAPTNLTSTSVTLSGSVNPNGFETEAFIQFGTTSAFGSELARQAVGNGVAPVNMQTTIGSLVPGATYYYRMVAINSEGGASYATAQTFRAAAPVTAAPTISGVSPSPVTGSNNAQPLTINGSNFVSGANITLRDKSTGEVFPNRIASSFSSTQIVINPRLTTAAATWSVNVVNPDGASTGEHVFQVVAPPVASTTSLSFTGLTPTNITATAKPFDVTLTASGSNFSNVNKIVWVASGATTGTFTWSRFGSSWIDAFGVAKSALVDSDTSMRLTPRVVGSTDTWSGTTNWTVTLTDTAGATAIRTFTVNYMPTSTATPSALSITTTALNPATATVGVGYGAQAAIAATGGTTPYSCSASGLPSGMAMNASTCAVYGTPTVSGTFNVTVTVTDSSSPQKTASKVLTLTVSPAATTALSITTTAFNPATATVGVGYGAQAAIAAIGGQTPYSCSASGLPSGMAMNASSCAIYGTPSISGTFYVTVTVTDSSNPQKTASKVLALTVSPAATAALSITTTAFNPATATVGVGYGAQAAIAAIGGQTPYSCSASGLPSGMAMNSSSCAIYGAPTISGTFYVTVTVTDSSNPQKTASKMLTLTVSPSATPALSIITTSLPSATVGVGYAQGVAVSGGQTPYTWYVSSGYLPSGLYINSTTGAIYGTPSVSGTYYFTVTAYDSSSTQKTASKALSLNVGSAVVALAVNGIASSYFASSGTYQPYISLSGSGFSTNVSQIYFTCARNGISCGNYTWTSANWNGKYIVYSNTSAVIAPVLTVSSDPAGTYNWSVTFSGGGQSVTKYFTVTK